MTCHFADDMPFVCGGSDGSGTYYDTCYKYSPLTDSWQESGTMPSRRAYSAWAYLESFGLVMAGGYDGSRYLDSVIVTKDGYTFDTLQSLPIPSSHGCLAVVDDNTLLMTGGNPDARAVHSYDIISDTWTR